MRHLKSNRSILPYLLLGFLTFGIYNLWYLHHFVKDVNELCREDGKQSPGVLWLLLLSILTCGLYGLFWWYRIADMISTAQRKRGFSSSVSGGYILVCMVLGAYLCGLASWIALHTLFEAMNELATDYNNKLECPPADVGSTN